MKRALVVGISTLCAASFLFLSCSAETGPELGKSRSNPVPSSAQQEIGNSKVFVQVMGGWQEPSQVRISLAIANRKDEILPFDRMSFRLELPSGFTVIKSFQCDGPVKGLDRFARITPGATVTGTFCFKEYVGKSATPLLEVKTLSDGQSAYFRVQIG